MSSTATIANICQIAESFAQERGFAPFEIDRIVHSRTEGADEWIVHLQFVEPAPIIHSEDQGAIVVVDQAAGTARLIEGL